MSVLSSLQRRIESYRRTITPFTAVLLAVVVLLVLAALIGIVVLDIEPFGSAPNAAAEVMGDPEETVEINLSDVGTADGVAVVHEGVVITEEAPPFESGGADGVLTNDGDRIELEAAHLHDEIATLTVHAYRGELAAGDEIDATADSHRVLFDFDLGEG